MRNTVVLENNVTIAKYQVGDEFFFHVMDKFDEPDEVERLQKMMNWLSTVESDCRNRGINYKQLWVKTTPII